MVQFGSILQLPLIPGVFFWTGIAVLAYYNRRRYPFNPVVPSVLWAMLSGISFALVVLSSRMWEQSIWATLLVVGTWLMLAAMTVQLMRRKSRSLGG